MLGWSPKRLISIFWAVPWVNRVVFSEHETPASCISKSQDLISLASCLDDFIVPHGYYSTAEMYQATQPTLEQRNAWRSTVISLLSVDGNCSALTVPPTLEEIYSFHTFPAGGSQKTYCVLIEHSVDSNGFSRGWGSVIVPESQATVACAVHFSAPHPQYDLGTVEQAAALFELVGAKSLLIAGRTRTALMEPSPCIVPNGSQPYYITDPAHNNLEPFFDAAVTIYEWQHAQSKGCPSSSCAFIQMHGKGNSTCPSDQVFMSSGLRNNSWYTSPTDYPIKRLRSNLQHAFPPNWNISLPSDSKCGLTATTNVAGRYINGIPESKVCSSAPAPSQVTGEFVHIEQASSSRSRDVYQPWARALRETFQPPFTAELGIVPDPVIQYSLP